jgi:hypothetical protein
MRPAGTVVRVSAYAIGMITLLAAGCGIDRAGLCGSCDAGLADRGSLPAVDGGSGDSDDAGDSTAGADTGVESSPGDVDATPDPADADADGPGVVMADAGPPPGDANPDAEAGTVVVADAHPGADAALEAGGPIDAGPWRRDWILHPAVYLQTAAPRLWGLSDVHGDRSRLIVLLGAAGLVGGTAVAPTWTGGTDTLVVSGDSIDKGSQSVEVLDTWIALIPQAEAAGGHLVVLLGNHEAEFLGDPLNSKAAPLVAEIGTEPPATFASPADPHGRFLRERPIAAVVDGWFFTHAGDSGGLSAAQIASTFRTLVDADDWTDDFFLDPNSILEARSWWPSSGTSAFLDGYLAALPAHHFVFGHHPTSFADPPTGNIEVHQQGRLLLIDVGMSSAVNYSTGKLLRVDHPGTATETVGMVTPAGALIPLDLTAP